MFRGQKIQDTSWNIDDDIYVENTRKTYCIFKIWLKYFLSTGHCTVLGKKTQPIFKSPSLSSLCFIFQKHLGCMRLAMRIGMFRSSKRKPQMSIFILFYTRTAWMIKCHVEKLTKWAPTVPTCFYFLAKWEAILKYVILFSSSCFFNPVGILNTLFPGSLHLGSTVYVKNMHSYICKGIVKSVIPWHHWWFWL